MADDFVYVVGGDLDVGWTDAEGHHMYSFTAAEVEDGTFTRFMASVGLSAFGEAMADPLVRRWPPT